MNRAQKAGGFAVVLSVLLAGGAVAGINLEAAGVLHQYCSGADATPHPRLLVMRQPITSDELATLGGTLFVAIYQPEVQPQQAGKITVRVRIKRADGSTERIGKLVVRQDEGGVAEIEEWFPVAARQGDTVIWRHRFKNFGLLNTDECVLLIDATAKP